jgi:hypothetical protein
VKNIGVGDAVVALKNGGHDSAGLPSQRPIAGCTYRITSIYEMKYGLGCTLKGMDPFPYRGYFLYVRRSSTSGRVQKGWYFERVEKADPEFTEALYDLLRSKEKVDG